MELLVPRAKLFVFVCSGHWRLLHAGCHASWAGCCHKLLPPDRQPLHTTILQVTTCLLPAAANSWHPTGGSCCSPCHLEPPLQVQAFCPQLAPARIKNPAHGTPSSNHPHERREPCDPSPVLYITLPVDACFACTDLFHLTQLRLLLPTVFACCPCNAYWSTLLSGSAAVQLTGYHEPVWCSSAETHQ